MLCALFNIQFCSLVLYLLYVWKCWDLKEHLLAQCESVMTDYNVVMFVVYLWSCWLFYDVME